MLVLLNRAVLSMYFSPCLSSPLQWPTFILILRCFAQLCGVQLKTLAVLFFSYQFKFALHFPDISLQWIFLNEIKGQHVANTNTRETSSTRQTGQRSRKHRDEDSEGKREQGGRRETGCRKDWFKESRVTTARHHPIRPLFRKAGRAGQECVFCRDGNSPREGIKRSKRERRR